MYFSLMYLRVLLLIVGLRSLGVQGNQYECGEHGRFENCVDDVSGCVVGCHCHPGYYFDTETKICEPNAKLMQDYRRHIMPVPIPITPADEIEMTATLSTKSPLDKQVDQALAQDTEDIGDWLYNQFFKTIENQVLSANNNTGNNDTDANNQTRRSGTTQKKAKRRKVKKIKFSKISRKDDLRRKLLRITEDDSLFDSDSRSTSNEDYGSSSDYDSSDSTLEDDDVSCDKNDKDKNNQNPHPNDKEHGHRKILVVNKKPKPPLPSFIFLPNLETPFYPPIGLPPPPPMPMFPMVPVPPMPLPPFPVTIVIPNESNEKTKSPTTSTTSTTTIPTLPSEKPNERTIIRYSSQKPQEIPRATWRANTNKAIEDYDEHYPENKFPSGNPRRPVLKGNRDENNNVKFRPSNVGVGDKFNNAEFRPRNKEHKHKFTNAKFRPSNERHGDKFTNAKFRPSNEGHGDKFTNAEIRPTNGEHGDNFNNAHFRPRNEGHGNNAELGPKNQVHGDIINNAEYRPRNEGHGDKFNNAEFRPTNEGYEDKLNNVEFKPWTEGDGDKFNNAEFRPTNEGYGDKLNDVEFRPTNEGYGDKFNNAEFRPRNRLPGRFSLRDRMLRRKKLLQQFQNKPHGNRKSMKHAPPINPLMPSVNDYMDEADMMEFMAPTEGPPPPPLVDFKYISQLIHKIKPHISNEQVKNKMPEPQRRFESPYYQPEAPVPSEPFPAAANELPPMPAHQPEGDDRFYANLGQQIASLIRKIDKTAPQPNPKTQSTLGGKINGDSGFPSRSYWERSVRSLFSHYSPNSNDIHFLKNEENLLNLENKVKVVTTTQRTWDLNELENYIFLVDKIKSQVHNMKMKTIQDAHNANLAKETTVKIIETLKPLKTSETENLNVNLLPRQTDILLGDGKESTPLPERRNIPETDITTTINEIKNKTVSPLGEFINKQNIHYNLRGILMQNFKNIFQKSEKQTLKHATLNGTNINYKSIQKPIFEGTSLRKPIRMDELQSVPQNKPLKPRTKPKVKPRRKHNGSSERLSPNVKVLTKVSSDVEQLNPMLSNYKHTPLHPSHHNKYIFENDALAFQLAPAQQERAYYQVPHHHNYFD